MPKQNKNCLEGIECPRCGSQGPFRIACTSMMDVEDDGTGDCEDIEWDDKSYCECRNCSAYATVRYFRITNKHKLYIPDKTEANMLRYTHDWSVLDLKKCRKTKRGGHRG